MLAPLTDQESTGGVFLRLAKLGEKLHVKAPAIYRRG